MRAEEPAQEVADVKGEGSQVSNERMADANRRAAIADKNYAKLRSVCVGARQVLFIHVLPMFQPFTYAVEVAVRPRNP